MAVIDFIIGLIINLAVDPIADSEVDKKYITKKLYLG